MRKLILIFTTIFMLFSLQACLQKDYMIVLPAPIKIAVAPYNQPTTESQLLAGYLPNHQNFVDEETLKQYNIILKEKLQQTNRNYIFLTEKDLNINIQKDSKGRYNVLATWAKLAQNVGADYIIVPQIIDIQEKKGKDRDVWQPARLISDFYFIKAIHPETESTDGYLQFRSHYKEWSFIDVNVSGEDYITPRQYKEVIEFVKESMNKMIRDFHLRLN